MTQPAADRKPVIFSGIQPTGRLTLGNYMGAIRNWVNLQEQYDCYYCVVDMHAITVRNEAAELRRRTLETIALLLACGLDPEKNTIFVQSHVPAHAELGWVLGCYTYMGELGRMTQFKDKSQRHEDNINAGLFTYPALMAADILLYQTDLVPVGADQKQHLELARDIAARFNNAYSPTFRVPEPYIPPVGAKIMSLQSPMEKMSKSDLDENATIRILDEPNVIRAKFRRAVTDSESGVRYDVENKPGIANLMTIFSVATGMGYSAIEQEFSGKGYGVFKDAVADSVVAVLEPLQRRYQEYLVDKGFLEEVMAKSAAKANRAAARTMSKVRRKIGFLDLPGEKR